MTVDEAEKVLQFFRWLFLSKRMQLITLDGVILDDGEIFGVVREYIAKEETIVKEIGCREKTSDIILDIKEGMNWDDKEFSIRILKAIDAMGVNPGFSHKHLVSMVSSLDP